MIASSPEYILKDPRHHSKNAINSVETLMFFHHNSLLSTYNFTSSSIEPFPFLPYQEYAFTPQSPIENDKYLNTSLSTVSQTEKTNIILSRIKTFVSPESNSHFKLAFINNTPFYMEALGIDATANHLVPALSKIIDESFQLRLQFLKINKEIIDYLYSQGAKGYELILNNEINILNELFNQNTYENNKHMQVVLFENYVAIAECLNKKDLGDIILTKIISISLDSSHRDDIDNLILIVKMMGSLSYKFEKDYNEQFIVPQMMMISQNKNENVKIEVCSVLPLIAKNVSFDCIKDKINKILSSLINERYIKLMVKVTEILCDIVTVYHEKAMYDPNVSNEVYISMYKKMIYINNKEIRLSAFNILGKFISLLSYDEIDSTYITYYTSIIDEYYFNKKDFKLELDMSLLYPSAYNFPAVLFCYGKANWKSLKNTYMNLSKDSDEKIILSLIDSFDEVSDILGNEITEKELLVLYDSFLNNPSQKVHNKAVDKLTKTMKKLSIETKKKFIIYYKSNFGFEDEKDITAIHLEKVSYEKWREKIKEAEIIECFFDVFDMEIIYYKILPVLILMSLDDFHEVRRECGKVMSKILSFLYKNEKYKEKVKRIIKAFAFCVSYQMRMEFLDFCEELLSDTEMYQEFLKEVLKVISCDRISHVKISLAKMISNIVDKKQNIMKKYLLYDEDFLKICFKVMNDNNIKSVQNIFKEKNLKEKIYDKIKEKNLDMNELQKEIEENKFYYKFNNDMQVLIDEFDIALPKVVTNYELDRDSKDYLKKFY